MLSYPFALKTAIDFSKFPFNETVSPKERLTLYNYNFLGECYYSFLEDLSNLSTVS